VLPWKVETKDFFTSHLHDRRQNKNRATNEKNDKGWCGDLEFLSEEFDFVFRLLFSEVEQCKSHDRNEGAKGHEESELSDNHKERPLVVFLLSPQG